MSIHRLITYLLFAFLCIGAAHAETILMVPDPALYGAAGDTVGWGFTLTSLPTVFDDTTITPWVVVSDLTFEAEDGTEPIGSFTPFITLGQNYQVVGPDTGNGEVNPFTQAFDPVAQTGLAAYTINDFQSVGDTVDGLLTLSYDLYSVSPNDPSFDPDTDFIGPGTATADVSVTVGSAPIPEPGTIAFAAAGLAMILALRFQQRKGVCQ